MAHALQRRGQRKLRVKNRRRTTAVEDAARLHLANAGRAVPQLHQCIGGRPTQLPNRFVSKERSRASEPLDVDIQCSQLLLQLRDLELKGRVFACPELPDSITKRADFRRQVLEI